MKAEQFVSEGFSKLEPLFGRRDADINLELESKKMSAPPWLTFILAFTYKRPYESKRSFGIDLKREGFGSRCETLLV